ncbi:MAG: histidine--tRNA ligase [Bacteroidia bacterium]|nr:histidine--tRNA ligase [Bacteroidia bacterium]
MKPSIPKGTRDFNPEQVIKRSYIFDVIKDVFQRFGYQPIETPSMENLSTLTGKYGEEGDKLLFKVLNNGDYLVKADKEALGQRDSTKLTPSIAKRGMRYDLTVPFARYVVMHRNEINFPFKRYQIQPVWRADRPQKGRYQEFYQCDADIVGSDSLVFEAEYVLIFDQVFDQLGMEVTIKLNNRKILAGIASLFDIEAHFVDLTVAIDKLDKIGPEKVSDELRKKGISETAIRGIEDLLKTPHYDKIKEVLRDDPIGSKGIEEIDNVLKYLEGIEIKNNVEVDITLARGLNYYTGCILEVKSDEFEIGSLCGGGRYDDLTGNFGMKGVSGVGISFGAARIYDVMEALDKFPALSEGVLKVIVVALDDACHLFGFKITDTLRLAGINAEIYPSPVKLKKQMKYANDRSIPFAIIIGSDEMESGKLVFKNMTTGEQQKLSLESIKSKLKE